IRDDLAGARTVLLADTRRRLGTERPAVIGRGIRRPRARSWARGHARAMWMISVTRCVSTNGYDFGRTWKLSPNMTWQRTGAAERARICQRPPRVAPADLNGGSLGEP